MTPREISELLALDRRDRRMKCAEHGAFNILSPHYRRILRDEALMRKRLLSALRDLLYLQDREDDHLHCWNSRESRRMREIRELAARR